VNISVRQHGGLGELGRTVQIPVLDRVSVVCSGVPRASAGMPLSSTSIDA